MKSSGKGKFGSVNKISCFRAGLPGEPHVQVIINCLNFVAQLCTREDGLAYILGTPAIDDVMSYNSLTTLESNVLAPIRSPL